MEIMFHSHHAEVSDHMRRRAQRGIEKVARRLSRAVDAIVRFEGDGPLRRVEIVLHAPRSRKLVAAGEGRFFGTALAVALSRMEARTGRVKRAAKERARRIGRG